MRSTTTSRKKCRQPRPRISTRSRKVRSTVNSWWDRCANLERETYAEEAALGQHAHMVSCAPMHWACEVHSLTPKRGLASTAAAAATALSTGTRNPCSVEPADLCRQ